MKGQHYTFSEVYGEQEDKTYDINEDITVWVNVNSCLTWELIPVENSIAENKLEDIQMVEIVENSQPK